MKMLKKCAVLALALCIICLSLTGCSTSKTLATVNGNAITDGFFAFYMYQYLSVMATDLGDNMVSADDMVSSSVTVHDYVKDIVYDSIVEDYATIALGKEHGITFNSEDAESAKAYKASFRTQLEQTGVTYTQLLKGIGATDKDVDHFCENASLITRITTEIYGEKSPYYPSENEIKNITDDFHQNYTCVTYVIQSTTDSTGAALNEAEMKKSMDACLAAKKAFEDGEDVATVVQAYSEDASSREAPYTIYFTMDAVSDEALLKGVKDLKIGETSEILETSNGLMVLKRLELDDVQITALIEEYMEQNIEERKTELTDGFSVLKTSEYDAFHMDF